MLNFIDNYSFIPMNGCVGMAPQCTALPRPIMLLRRP
jgi:hypothetical protein